MHASVCSRQVTISVAVLSFLASCSNVVFWSVFMGGAWRGGGNSVVVMSTITYALGLTLNIHSAAIWLQQMHRFCLLEAIFTGIASMEPQNVAINNGIVFFLNNFPHWLGLLFVSVAAMTEAIMEKEICFITYLKITQYPLAVSLCAVIWANRLFGRKTSAIMKRFSGVFTAGNHFRSWRKIKAKVKVLNISTSLGCFTLLFLGFLASTTTLATDARFYFAFMSITGILQALYGLILCATVLYHHQHIQKPNHFKRSSITPYQLTDYLNNKPILR